MLSLGEWPNEEPHFWKNKKKDDSHTSRLGKTALGLETDTISAAMISLGERTDVEFMQKERKKKDENRSSRLSNDELESLRIWITSELAAHRASLQAAIAENGALLRAELFSQKEMLFRMHSKTQVTSKELSSNGIAVHEAYEVKKPFNRTASSDPVLMSKIHQAVSDVHGKLPVPIEEEDGSAKHPTCCFIKCSRPKRTDSEELEDVTANLSRLGDEFWDEYMANVDDTIVGRVVKHRFFDIAVACSISLCFLLMFVELEWFGYKARVALDINPDDGWKHAETLFLIAEHIFNIIFLIELVFRCMYLRQAIVEDGFAMFDFVLVSITSIHLYILKPLDLQTSMRPTVLRLLRITNIVRVFRLARVAQFFVELRVLVNTCYSCIRALVWSMVLLSLVMTIGAFFLTFLLHDFILDDNADHNLRRWAYMNFGSGLISIYTFYEITLAGCWPQYFRPLVERINGWYSVFVLIYISVVVFALIRVIGALFLKETLQNASADNQAMINEQRVKKSKYIKKLTTVFNAVDASRDGKLSKEEFERVVSHPTVRNWFQVLDVEWHDIDTLFQLLDDGDGLITYEEFVQGLFRLRGQAREVDAVAILRTQDTMKSTLNQMSAQVERILAKLQDKSQ